MSITTSETATTECALCGLTLPRCPVEGAAGESYCCHGCAHVAAILRSVGTGSEEGRVRLEAARRHGLLSAIEGQARPAVEVPAESRAEVRFRVDGLVCPSCAWLVEAVISAQAGVAVAEVDFFSDTARVVFDLRKTSGRNIEQAVLDSGYGVATLDSKPGAQERRDWLRLAFAAIIGMNQMTLSWVGYDIFLGGGGVEPQSNIIGWIQVLLAIPVVTWAAFPIYRRAWAALRHGRAVMESLLALGIVAAAMLSLISVLEGQVHVYLETATMLVAISLGGRALEQWTRKRAARSLTEILRFSPTKARRADSGQFAPISQFQRGQEIVVEPGEVVPLDVRASSDVVVREGLLTGEPHPVERRAGEVVLAGSSLERGRLIGKVERPAGQTVADTIRGRVAGALRRTDAGSRLADRLAQGFVPLVVLIAVAALVGHVVQGSEVRFSLLAAVSVLVVACPCAFGVAASSATSLALLRLARGGVLVKEPQTLETLKKIDLAVFDKTGTLTQGNLELVKIGWINGEQPELLAAVRALEDRSRHPVAVTLTRVLPRVENIDVAGVAEIPGVGVTGMVGGHHVAVGTPRLFEALTAKVEPPATGVSRVWFGYASRQPTGHIDLADRLRPEARTFVAACKGRGIETVLFSGDAQETSDAIAAEAGIEKAFGGLRPEEKAERVRSLRRRGQRVLYVGDGFNDAEALAAAEVGVALGTGADVAMLTAPVVITNGNLDAILELLDVSKSTSRIVRANFFWAFAYNVALLPVAALGLLAPIYAAALMAVSSASVALNAVRAGSSHGVRQKRKETARERYASVLTS